MDKKRPLRTRPHARTQVLASGAAASVDRPACLAPPTAAGAHSCVPRWLALPAAADPHAGARARGTDVIIGAGHGFL